MIRRSQAATLSPSRTRSQQMQQHCHMIMTRSQTAALSPMIMTRSQAATAGRHAGFTNPGSGVGGMSGRSQQERQQGDDNKSNDIYNDFKNDFKNNNSDSKFNNKHHQQQQQ
ncbi:hypothetical protein MHU86_4041 [Fragilaria crotonensis]|nr:hypothetical protein MHU86_4041 [Fragilaria crotonensis]